MNPYLRLEDKTTWPNPDDPKEVQHRLRYGTPNRGDLLLAASVMQAYAYIVSGPGAAQLPLIRKAARLAAAESEAIRSANPSTSSVQSVEPASQGAQQ
jgi:hypothetical protein